MEEKNSVDMFSGGRYHLLNSQRCLVQILVTEWINNGMLCGNAWNQNFLLAFFEVSQQKVDEYC